MPNFWQENDLALATDEDAFDNFLYHAFDVLTPSQPNYSKLKAAAETNINLVRKVLCIKNMKEFLALTSEDIDHPAFESDKYSERRKLVKALQEAHEWLGKRTWHEHMVFFYWIDNLHRKLVERTEQIDEQKKQLEIANMQIARLKDENTNVWDLILNHTSQSISKTNPYFVH